MRGHLRFDPELQSPEEMTLYSFSSDQYIIVAGKNYISNTLPVFTHLALFVQQCILLHYVDMNSKCANLICSLAFPAHHKWTSVMSLYSHAV